MLSSQHFPKHFRTALLASVSAAVALGGCNCGGGTVVKNHPNLSVSPAALAFAACPTQDENGQAVADVFPDKQSFTLENLGKGPATLTYELTGAGKDQFQITEETKASSLDGLGSTTIDVLFTPNRSGDTNAELVIDDGDPDETSPSVHLGLIGTGSNLPAQPTIKISFEDPTTHEFTECVPDFNGQISNCLVNWPDTFLDQTANVKMKITNTGCPTLKITDLSIAPAQGSSDLPQFVMEEPANPPTADAPALLSTADGTQELPLNIRFEPKDDGTGDGQRYATLTVKSNSKTSPESLVTLFGYTVTPAIYATPTFCDYTDPSDTCNGTKVPTTGNDKKAIFMVTNGGTTDVVIDSVSFRMPASGRFTIGAQNPLNKTIAPGASEPLEILYTDAPLYVTDIIDVTGTAMGQNAGIASIRVSGGVLPCLRTEPVDKLDFSMATGSPATLPVNICNGTMAGECGTLVLNSVTVTQTATLYKVTTPIASGTTVDSGQCKSVNVQFSKPISGGTQAGTLEISSNDPKYAAPANYKLPLYSMVPLNQVPEAVLAGPGGQTNAFSVDLSTTVPPELLIHGEGSFDPPDYSASSPGGIMTYQFFLAQKPTGATADLVDPANKTMSLDGVKTSKDKVLLKLDPNLTGQYKLLLIVFDSTGQKSQQVELKLLVNP